MKYDEYLTFHYSFYRTLIIQMGLHCPLRCKHCSVFAGPKRNEQIPTDLLLRVVRDFGSAGEDRLVVLTGGEPFAMKDNALRKVLDVIDACENLRSYVITAAPWAASESVAEQILGSMPPISLLAVSADSYHEEFVPLEFVAHAVHAALSLGRDVLVSIAVEPQNPGYINRVKDAIGDRVWSQIEHDVVPVMPTGRAKNYGIGTFNTVPTSLPEGACELLGTPVVLHDGSVSACCQIDATNEIPRQADSVYRIGNVLQDSYADLRNRVECNAIFQAIRVWGPSGLVRLLHEAGIKVRLKSQYDGICFLCRDLLTNPETVAALKRVLSDAHLKNEIRLSRVVQYGELRPCPAGVG